MPVSGHKAGCSHAGLSQDALIGGHICLSFCRELTRPAIIKRDGVMIQPLRYSKSLADQKLPANNAQRKTVAVVSGGMPKKSKC